jgi:squalene monooxygenase
MYDVCIVGAGIAGSSLAAVIGRKGFHIALIDRRWNEPNEIIGELLQPGGVEKLKEMGLEEALEGIDAQPIRGYAMRLQDNWLTIDYKQEEGFLPLSGFGFRYGRFVQNLRQLCRKSGSIDCIQGNVEEIIQDRHKVHGVRIRNGGDTENLFARLTIICQGSQSSLGKSLNKSRTEIKGFMLGLILKGCNLPYEHYGHIILADPAPILSYPVGKDKIRVLIDFPKDVPSLKAEARTQYLLEKILPQMPVELQEGFERAVREGGHKAKATSLLASRPIIKKGILLLGDSLNMRHPITGGGMTVAFTDVKALADKLQRPGDLDEQNIMKEIVQEFYRDRHQENASINILAYALYCIFRHGLLKRACFNYLREGGVNAYEPMSILSGTSRNRITLFKHFFAVAVYALLHRVKMRQGSSNPRNADEAGIFQSISALFYAVRILIPLVLDEIPRIYRK